MRIDCPAHTLLAAVKRTLPAVAPSRYGIKPGLASLLIRGTPDGATISGSDTEIGIRTDVAEASCPQRGVAVVPADQLAAALGEIDGDDDVSLVVEEDSTLLTLTAPGTRFDLPTSSPDEFPEFVIADDGGAWFELTGDTFRTLVRRTVFACGKSDGARFAMTGVLVEREGPRVNLVATDSKRLAITTSGVCGASGDADTDPKKPHIIPGKVLAAVEKVADGTVPVRIRLRPNMATFEVPGWSMTATLIEGRFPPYREIVKKAAGGVTINLDATGFAASVRRAAVMTDRERSRIDFEFQPAIATLKATHSKGGAGNVAHACPGYSGPKIEVALDPVYVLDWFRAVGSGPVTLELADSIKPVLFKAGDQATYLAMPLTE